MSYKYVKIPAKFTYPAIIFVTEKTAQKLNEKRVKIGDSIKYREHPMARTENSVVDRTEPVLTLIKM